MAAVVRPELPPLWIEQGEPEEALWGRMLRGHAQEGTSDGLEASSGEVYVHIDEQGKARMVAVDKHELVRCWGVRYRDLFSVDPTLPLPTPSVILVRPRAIVVNLDVGGSIKMVVAENQVLVMGVPKVSDPRVTALPTLDHPFVRRLCRCLHRTEPSRRTLAEGGKGVAAYVAFDQDMPYELKALEVALAAAVGILGAEIARVEEATYPLVDAMVRSLDKGVLEGVRAAKQAIERLQAKAGRIHQELEELLGDDADMRDMFLGRRAAEQGLGPLAQQWAADEEQGGKGGGGPGGDEDEEQGGEGGGGPGGGEDEEAGGSAGAAPTAGAEAWRASGARRALAQQRGPARRHRAVQPHVALRHGRRRPGHAGHGRGLGDPGASMRSSAAGGPGAVAAGGGARPPSPAFSGDDADAADDAAWSARSGSTPHAPSFAGSSLLLAVDPREIEDAEDLLEAYYVKADLLLRRLLLVDERINDTEDFVEIQLDQRRNEIVSFNLLTIVLVVRRRNEIVSLNLFVGTVSMALGWTAAVGGIFGMNLLNVKLQSEAWVLALVLATMAVVSCALLAGVVIFARRHKLMFIPKLL